MAEWSLARLDEIPTDRTPEWWSEWSRTPNYGGGWHSVRKHFGIQAFGVNACEADAGEELELGAGDLLHVPADVEREATALADGTLVFMVGGTPGKPYERWDEKW